MNSVFKIILISGMFSMSLSCAAQDNSNSSYEISDIGVSKVVVPPLPKHLDFAGERVPLENHDTRESMEEDLMVTMYMHSRTMTTLRNTKRYFAIIEPILEKNGIPADFKYLAMAESSLNPEAHSPAKAAGLWQILASTATPYGLEVNGDVDERYHIEKSTEIACKYLKQAYEKFGSWTMAAASYNVGQAGVSRRSEKQGVNNYYDLFLPTETMRYMFRILSFKLVTEFPEDYGFMLKHKDYYAPYKYETVEIKDVNIDWSSVAKKYGITYKLLRELNPWIRDYGYVNKLGKTYQLKIINKDNR